MTSLPDSPGPAFSIFLRNEPNQNDLKPAWLKDFFPFQTPEKRPKTTINSPKLRLNCDKKPTKANKAP